MTFVERSANEHWSIRLLGGFGLSGPHGRVEVPPAGQRLVAYLAIQGHPVRRSTVAAGIWPDVDETRARANLRSTLSRLGALAPVIHATAASLTIAPDVVVDIEDLQLQVTGVGSREPRSTGGRHGFDLELLPGWEEEWVALERERFRQLELHLLDDVVNTSVNDGRHGDGVDAALRAIRLDPWRESSHAGLLRALLAGGNRAAALAHFRRFAAQMREELGLPPSRDLLDVVGEILPARPARRG
jgi:SARP family transcriptional regulator, regulator of embCAB operon